MKLELQTCQPPVKQPYKTPKWPVNQCLYEAASRVPTGSLWKTIPDAPNGRKEEALEQMV